VPRLAGPTAHQEDANRLAHRNAEPAAIVERQGIVGQANFHDVLARRGKAIRRAHGHLPSGRQVDALVGDPLAIDQDLDRLPRPVLPGEALNFGAQRHFGPRRHQRLAGREPRDREIGCAGFSQIDHGQRRQLLEPRESLATIGRVHLGPRLLLQVGEEQDAAVDEPRLARAAVT
jgi:hypothetical protein